jgi:uncharacterized protein YdiU (UPF0061 family)
VLREYLVSEAMTALGVPSTRTLAAVLTGESVFRDQALPGAILTRIAASHVRVGTFQYFAARSDVDAVRVLADYVIERHYPDLLDSGARYLELLRVVMQRHARLVAKWLQVGFIHGVMNTDNTTVSGETIDFGPCAFLDAYDPDKVFSSIDGHGRYAYANQPAIAQWNLARFAETLLPLIDVDEKRAIESASEAIGAFTPEFEHHWLNGMRAKLGLTTADSRDLELIQRLLEIMQRTEADFTNTFRGLCFLIEPSEVTQLCGGDRQFAAWLSDWRLRRSIEPLTPAGCATLMRSVNPKYIPRNHRIEQLIAAAAEHDDFSRFETLLNILTRPYDEQPEAEEYVAEPHPEERVAHTFCGT